MSGQLLRHPPIAVDYWKLRVCSHVRLFFLSHMHSDHTQGLTPSWSQPIYCSPVTRLLLIDQFKLDPEQVHGLTLNDCHCLPLSEETSESLSVTLIDANHCPGAVMFLLEGYFGRVLYTGDFRYSPLINTEESFARVCSSAIDRLYLDNTFCSPRCVFPTREKAVCEIIRIISEHPDHRVVVGLRKLGKESLLVIIAKQFHTRIFVTEDRLRRLELLRMTDVFTTLETDTRISVVDQGLITRRNMDIWNKEVPTVAIIPTALYTALNVNSGLNREDVFVVTYSDHSSFAELCEFVAVVGPREVIPILSGVKDRLGKMIPERADMSCFAKYLDGDPPRPFSPPIEFTRDVAKVRPCVANISVPSRKIKKFRFVGGARAKGVVYEHGSGDELGQKSTPRGEDSVTAGNAGTGRDELVLENSKGTNKVEQNGLTRETAVNNANAVCQDTCVVDGANLCRRKNGSVRLECRKVFHKIKSDDATDGFNFCRTGSEPALLSVSSEACKRSHCDSEKMVGIYATEDADSFSKDRTNPNLPSELELECEDGLRCSVRGSPKLVRRELEGNNDSLNSCHSDSEHSVPLVSAKELKDLKSKDSSRYHLLNDIKANLSTIDSEQTVMSVPLKEHEGVSKCSQGIFTTQCSEGNGEVTVGVNLERPKLSDLILQSLKPVFEEEAKSIFEDFLRTRKKH